MIKIRYRGPNELSPGLHATAERNGRRTTVYLLDGMTADERRSALRRLRLSARMGHCPRLPAVQLALALTADRIRTGFGRAGAVLRLHPAGSTVPIMVLSGGAIAFLLFSTVSIHVLHRRAADQSDAGAAPVVSATAIAITGGSHHHGSGRGGAGHPGDPGGPADPRGPGGSSGAGPLFQPGRGSATGPPPALAADGGPGTSTGRGSDGAGSVSGGSTRKNDSTGGTTLTGGADPTQAGPPPTTPATTDPAPPTTNPSDPSAPPTSSSSGSSGGTCIDVGPLGVCLNL